jgi:hypothetical protein
MTEDRAYLNGQLVMDSKQELVDEIERLRKELKYWERIGRDKLDAELVRGLASEAPAPTGKQAP